MGTWSIEIALDSNGLRTVRIYGKSWEQPEAYALLGRLGPSLQQLHALVTAETFPEGPTSSRGSAE